MQWRGSSAMVEGQPAQGSGATGLAAPFLLARQPRGPLSLAISSPLANAALPSPMGPQQQHASPLLPVTMACQQQHARWRADWRPAKEHAGGQRRSLRKRNSDIQPSKEECWLAAEPSLLAHDHALASPHRRHRPRGSPAIAAASSIICPDWIVFCDPREMYSTDGGGFHAVVGVGLRRAPHHRHHVAAIHQSLSSTRSRNAGDSCVWWIATAGCSDSRSSHPCRRATYASDAQRRRCAMAEAGAAAPLALARQRRPCQHCAGGPSTMAELPARQCFLAAPPCWAASSLAAEQAKGRAGLESHLAYALGKGLFMNSYGGGLSGFAGQARYHVGILTRAAPTPPTLSLYFLFSPSRTPSLPGRRLLPSMESSFVGLQSSPNKPKSATTDLESSLEFLAQPPWIEFPVLLPQVEVVRLLPEVEVVAPLQALATPARSSASRAAYSLLRQPRRLLAPPHAVPLDVAAHPHRPAPSRDAQAPHPHQISGDSPAREEEEEWRDKSSASSARCSGRSKTKKRGEREREGERENGWAPPGFLCHLGLSFEETHRRKPTAAAKMEDGEDSSFTGGFYTTNHDAMPSFIGTTTVTTARPLSPSDPRTSQTGNAPKFHH
nr:unnamed protein product [Digitaria exilis]